MSRSERFGITATRAATEKLSKDALRLYVHLAGYADAATRIARPGQDRLAEELSWFSGGKPDRRRVFKAMNQLEDADLVREAGQYPLGKGRWVRMYSVAPFVGDAAEAYASTETGDANRSPDAAEAYASQVGSTPEADAQAGASTDTMRSIAVSDAYEMGPAMRQHDTRLATSSRSTSSSSHQLPANSVRERSQEEQEREEAEKRAKAHGPEFDQLLYEIASAVGGER